MTETVLLSKPTDEHAVLTAPDTIRLERWLPGPAERVWRYLTEPDLRAQWLAGGTMALHKDGPMELVFHNAQLSSADDDPPPAGFEGASREHLMQGRIIECDPPRQLAYLWFHDATAPSEVRFELAPRGERVLLTVTHTRIASREAMLSFTPGWHTHLAMLRARLSGDMPPPFWRTFASLRAEYARRLAQGEQG